MNGKKVACLMLIMIIAAIVYGTQLMQNAAAETLTAKNAANDEFIEANDACVKKEKDLKQRTEETSDLRQFLTTWTPVINKFQSSQYA